MAGGIPLRCTFFAEGQMSGLAGREKGNLLIEGRNNLLIWLKDQKKKENFSPKGPICQHFFAMLLAAPACLWLAHRLSAGPIAPAVLQPTRG